MTSKLLGQIAVHRESLADCKLALQYAESALTKVAEKLCETVPLQTIESSKTFGSEIKLCKKAIRESELSLAKSIRSLIDELAETDPTSLPESLVQQLGDVKSPKDEITKRMRQARGEISRLSAKAAVSVKRWWGGLSQRGKAITTVLVVMGLLTGWFALPRNPHGSDELLIVALEDEASLEQAVVKVVCGIRQIKSNGEKLVHPFYVGTGFFISSDGFLLTNRHVIQGTFQLKDSPLLKKLERQYVVKLSPMFWIFAGGEKYEAEIVHLSDEYDLCILKVDRKSGPFFSLSSQEEIARNRNVFVFGFPVSANIEFPTRQSLDERYLKEMRTDKIEDQFKESEFVFTSTVGIISRVRKDQNSPVWIQTDSVITPGNSGGPLLLHDGTVIGVNTLYNPKKSGYYWAVATFQMREEIDRHVSGVVWK